MSSIVLTWVEPLYKAKLTIIFDRKQPVFKQQFIDTYIICIKGPSPKCLKLGRDFEKKVKKIFGPCINRNGYHYTWSGDEQLIAEVERLWMTTHHKTKMPHTHMINKAKVQGFVCERKHKDIN
jgi:hypothetical protein